MSGNADNPARHLAELADLRARLDEAEETLRAIRSGAVDALVVAGPEGDQVFTLKSADEPYRMLVEEMNDGAVSLSADGLILYCNRRWAELVQKPLDRLVGTAFVSLVVPEDRAALAALLQAGRAGRSSGEIIARAADQTAVPLHLSVSRLPADSAAAVCLVAADLSGRKDWEAALAERSATLTRTVQDLEAARLAALNIMEDALLARRATEQALEALRASESKYRRLHETMTDAFVAVDMAGHILEFNPAYQAMLGYTDEELHRLTYQELTPENWRDFEARIVAEEILPKGHSGVYEKEYRRKDGTILPVELSVFLLQDTTGTPIGMWGIARDITARKQVELLLRARTELAEMLSSVGLHELLQLALDKAEQLTHSRMGFFHIVDADQLNLTLQCWSTDTMKHMCTAQGEGRHYPVNEAGVWADCIRDKQPVIHNECASLPHPKGLLPGHAPVVREAVVPVLRNGLVVGILGVGDKPTDYDDADVRLLEDLASTTMDFVQRKRAEIELAESEAQFRITFEQAAVGVAQVGLDGRWLRVNRRLCQIMGYSEDGLLGKTVQDITHPDDLEADLAFAGRLVSGEIQTSTMEKRYLRKDQSIVAINLTVSLVRGLKGEPKYFIAVLEDITERKHNDVIREVLHSLAFHLSAARSAIEVARNIFELADKLWRWDAAAFIVLRPHADQAETVLCVDVLDGKRQEVSLSDQRGSLPPRLRRVVAQGPELVLRPESFAEDMDTTQFGDSPRISASQMCVPIHVGNKILGVILLQSYTPNAFEQDDLGTLQMLADHSGSALERIVAEAEQALLLNTIQLSQNEIYLFDAATWHFRFVNDGALKNLGYTFEQIRQMTPLDLKPQFTDGRFSQLVEPLRQGAKVMQVFTTVHRRADGSSYPVEVHLQYFSHGGDPIFLAVVQDITERQRAEEALQEERSLLRTLVDHLPLAVYVKDTASRKTLVNPVDAFNLGLASPAEALGKTDFDFFPLAEARQFLADDQTVLQTGQSVLNREERLTRPDGSTAWLLTSKVPLRDAAGKIVGLVGIGLEITERRRIEDQLRKLARAVEHSPVSIIITDCRGMIEFVNPKFTQVTGYSAEEALGQNPRFLKSGETSPEEYGLLWATITAGKEWRGEFHNKRKDGTLYWESAVISAVRDATGEITHFIAVKEDITEKKLTETKFLRAQRIESIGSLASGIAHDLNNILSPILMGASLLKEDLSPQVAGPLIDTITSSAQRGAEIVRQLLTFARGKEGQKAPVPPDRLIREMARIVRETFPKSIILRTDFRKNLWTIQGDPTQLHQVLLNLCVNARDAMPEGGTLTLSADQVTLDDCSSRQNPEAKAGPYVILQVTDTGTGMAPAILDKIFDPFFTTKGPDLGTGLGLATTQRIVKNHGGFIQVESHTGRGSCFRVFLPARPAGTTAVTAATGPERRQGRGELILVVDDEPEVREITARILEQHGYRVLTANEGAAAIALYTQHQSEIRVVLTDMMMPNMDGPATVRVLRGMNPQLRIIAASGLTSKMNEPVIAALSVHAYLRKPFTAETLLVTVEQVLRGEAIQCQPDV